MAAQLFYTGSFAGVRCRCTVMMLNSVFRRYGEPRFVVLLLREHLRMPGKDLSQITLSRWEKFCFAMLDLSRRWGAGLYIITKKYAPTMRIRKG